jgi:hypothetical protein
MSAQIVMLQNSLRTNIAMARAMTTQLNLIMARKYLADAKKDKALLDTYRKSWNNDSTKTIGL